MCSHALQTHPPDFTVTACYPLTDWGTQLSTICVEKSKSSRFRIFKKTHKNNVYETISYSTRYNILSPNNFISDTTTCHQVKTMKNTFMKNK